MRSLKIHLIRHGKTQANVKKLYVGVTDYPLTDEGRAEVAKLTEEYSYPYIEALFSSPMTRAMQTAEIIYPDMDIIAVPELREYDFGEFENKGMAELSADPRFDSWIKSGMREDPPGGEVGSEFVARCTNGFRSVVNYLLMNGLTCAAIVSHGGVMLNLCNIFMPFSVGEDSNRFIVENGRGYTLNITPMLWQRDEIAEFWGHIPADAQSVFLNHEEAYNNITEEE